VGIAKKKQEEEEERTWEILFRKMSA